MNIDELKKRKKQLKLTVSDLAILADLPQGTVSKIMTGETKMPRLETMEHLEMAICREEQKRRIEAYLCAMKEYLQVHIEMIEAPYKFETIYRRIHNLEDKPIALADSLSERVPIWGKLALDKKKKISTNSFLHMGYENRWVELYEGTVIVSEAPGIEHQLMVKSINKQIEKYIEENQGKCQVFDMGLNVKLDEDEDSILIPDILVLCDEQKMRSFGVQGAPDWVIEVVSPSTRQYDYKKKSMKYLSHGVRELWLVDLEKRIVITYVNQEYAVSAIYPFGESVPVRIYDGKLRINCLQ